MKMTVAEQLETWQTISQQQLSNLATFEREHRTLVRGAVFVAVATTAGAVAGVFVVKGMLAAKVVAAVPAAIGAATTSQAGAGVAASLANSAATLGQAATLAKGAVTTGAATLQSANSLLSSMSAGGALSSQLATLLQTISSNALPLTAGAVGGGAVGAGVMQRQVNAVKDLLQKQTAQTTAYQAEAARLQQTLTNIATPKADAPANQPGRPTVQDPLEQIRGIGPVFARHLNAAGVFTFADLAAQTPEQLRAIMASARANRLFNPQAWIDEARQRIGQVAPPAPLPPEADSENGAGSITSA